MTDAELAKAERELAERNADDKVFQQALAEAGVALAQAQKVAADALAALKVADARQSLLSAERTANKAAYGKLYNQVGREHKRRLLEAQQQAEAERKAKEAAAAKE